MQEERKEKSVPLIAFLVVQIVVIIIIVAMISIFKKDDRIGDLDYDRQPSVSIGGLFNELPGATTEYIDDLERKLAGTVELNTENFSVSDSEAEIRPGTLKVLQLDGVEGYYFSAIVDIPNLQQSYQIYDQYPTVDSPPNSTPSEMGYILCIDSDKEIIYPEFNCKDLYSSNTRADIVSNYIAYFDFVGFTVSAEPGNREIYINLANSDASKDDQESYVEQTRSAVSSLGVPPEYFSYHITKLEDVNYESYVVTSN